MAYIKTYTRADGSKAHQVCYRDPDKGGKQSSNVFDDPNDAELLKSFLNANGQSFRRAHESITEMQSQAPTLNAVIASHLDGLTGIESGTVAKYRRMMTKHVEPTIGTRKLDSLTRQDIITWFAAIEGAPKTKRNIHAVVSSSLDNAVAEQLIGKNPAKGIKISSGSYNRREPVFLTRDEFENIAETIGAREPAPIQASVETFLRTLVGTGLRYSEATALRSHIDAKPDMKKRIIIHVTRAWKNADSGRVLGGPKTRKSRRSIAASAVLSERLTAHMSQQDPGDLTFGRPDTGAMMRASHFHERYWKPCIDQLLEDKKLAERPRVHDLRHTHASWLIAAGASPKVVQERMGHEDISTTFNVYGHLLTDADAAAADMLD